MLDIWQLFPPEGQCHCHLSKAGGPGKEHTHQKQDEDHKVAMNSTQWPPAPGGAAQEHLYLVTMLHEFCQVQESLSDFCNILRGQGQLNAPDQLILLVLIQLRPA